MKKIIAVIATLALALSTLTACDSENSDKFYGKNESANSDTNSDTETTSSESYTGVNIRTDYDLTIDDVSEYFTLGDYKNIEYSFDESIYDVSDDMINAAVASSLGLSAIEVSDRKAISGDIVNIDFAGTINGEKFEGCEAFGYEFIIGSNKLAVELEQSIIGMQIGETKTIDYIFPDNYSDENIAGKNSKFNITLNSIKEYNISEITNELIQENTNYQTVDEYTAYIKDVLEKDAEDQKNNAKAGTILDKIMKNSTVNGYDEEKLKELTDSAKEMVETYSKQYGMTKEEFIQQNYGFETYEEYEDNMEQTAKDYLDSIMLISAIANAENLTVTDSEYQDQINEYVNQYNISDEQLNQYYTSDDIIFSILVVKVQNWLLENSILI